MGWLVHLDAAEARGLRFSGQERLFGLHYPKLLLIFAVWGILSLAMQQEDTPENDGGMNNSSNNNDSGGNSGGGWIAAGLAATGGTVAIVSAKKLASKGAQVGTKLESRLGRIAHKRNQFMIHEAFPQTIDPDLMPKISRYREHLQFTTQNTANSLIKSLRDNIKNATKTDIEEYAKQLSTTSTDGIETRISVDGMFIDILVKNGEFKLATKFDIATITAKGAAILVTDLIVSENLFWHDRILFVRKDSEGENYFYWPGHVFNTSTSVRGMGIVDQ